jgi:hypothetical protein
MVKLVVSDPMLGVLGFAKGAPPNLRYFVN